MEFDYVIVGGGSAGCVLAGRLSEDPSVSVATGKTNAPTIMIAEKAVDLLLGREAAATATGQHLTASRRELHDALTPRA